MTRTVYISTDVEADGPIPPYSSMLSFASVAYAVGTDERSLGLIIGQLGTFEANLHLLPEATPDPDTMAWWAKNQAAYDATRQNLEDPKAAMLRYVAWLDSLSSKPVFVAYPAGYDFLWIYHYLIRFAGRSPFSFSALDIKSYAAAMLKKPYRDVSKGSMPQRWFSADRPHTHRALDDALEQGELFCNMLRESLGG